MRRLPCPPPPRPRPCPRGRSRGRGRAPWRFAGRSRLRTIRCWASRPSRTCSCGAIRSGPSGSGRSSRTWRRRGSSSTARHIGASLEALYKLRKRPGAEGFDAGWDAALDRGIARLEESALARAIEGEERMVVSAGKVLGVERRHNEALVMFLLRTRRPARYGADVQPGHPLYERIRAEVLAVERAGQMRSEEEVYAAIDAKLAAYRRREEAARVMLLDEGVIGGAIGS